MIAFCVSEGESVSIASSSRNDEDDIEDDDDDDDVTDNDFDCFMTGITDAVGLLLGFAIDDD